MYPNCHNATLRILDLEDLGVANKRSLIRWFHPRPLHIVSGAPKGVLYPLPEAVTRIRQRSRIGLSGDVLNKVVSFDAAARAGRGDDIYLGDDVEKRASEFVFCLAPKESERARAVQREIRAAALKSGLPGAGHLRKTVLIHPAAVKYILANNADELPCGDGGWRSFTNALWAVNPKNSNENQHLEEVQ